MKGSLLSPCWMCQRGSTPLHEAVKEGRVEAVGKILDWGGPELLELKDDVSRGT